MVHISAEQWNNTLGKKKIELKTNPTQKEPCCLAEASRGHSIQTLTKTQKQRLLTLCMGVHDNMKSDAHCMFKILSC